MKQTEIFNFTNSIYFVEKKEIKFYDLQMNFVRKPIKQLHLPLDDTVFILCFKDDKNLRSLNLAVSAYMSNFIQQ